MGDPGPAMLLVVFVDGDRTVDLGTVAVSPSPGAVRRLQAAVADRIGVAPHQISASLARPRRGTRRAVPLEEGADLAAAVAREGAGCYVLAGLRRSRRERRGGRSRRDKKNAHAANAAGPAPAPEKTILKRLPPTDLASLAGAGAAPPHAVFGHWDYEAQLLELQRQREWYLMRTAAADPYFALAPPPQPEPDHQDPAPPQLWPPLRAPSPSSSPLCPECEAAAAAARAPAFHWCVRDAVTVGFRSPVGPIERPAARKPTSPPPAFLGMPVY